MADFINTRRIVVTNLSFHCDEDKLYNYFADKLEADDIIVDHAEIYTTPEGNLTGVGVVEFGDISGVEFALQLGTSGKGTARRTELCGRTILFRPENEGDIMKRQKGGWTSKYEQRHGRPQVSPKAAMPASVNRGGRVSGGEIDNRMDRWKGGMEGGRGGRMGYQEPMGAGYDAGYDIGYGDGGYQEDPLMEARMAREARGDDTLALARRLNRVAAMMGSPSVERSMAVGRMGRDMGMDDYGGYGPMGMDGGMMGGGMGRPGFGRRGMDIDLGMQGGYDDPGPMGVMRSGRAMEEAGMMPPFEFAPGAPTIPIYVLEQLGIDMTQLTPAVFVSNLLRELEEDKIRQIFSLAGEVDDMDIFREKNTNEFRGQAIIIYHRVFNACQACSMLNEALIKGRKFYVRIDYMFDKEKRDRKKNRQNPQGTSCGLPAGLSSIGPGLSVRAAKKVSAPEMEEQPVIDPDILESLDLSGKILSNKLLVGNLDYKQSSQEGLEQIFKMAGEISKLTMHSDKKGNFNGRALVVYQDITSAVQCISMFRDQMLWGRRLVVTMDHRLMKDDLPEGLSMVGPGFGERGSAAMTPAAAKFDAFDPYNTKPMWAGPRQGREYKKYDNSQNRKRRDGGRDDHERKAKQPRREKVIENKFDILYMHGFDETTWPDLQKELEDAGSVESKMYQKKRGGVVTNVYALVHWKNAEIAKEKAEIYDQKEVGDKILTARVWTPKDRRPKPKPEEGNTEDTEEKPQNGNEDDHEKMEESMEETEENMTAMDY